MRCIIGGRLPQLRQIVIIVFGDEVRQAHTATKSNR